MARELKEIANTVFVSDRNYNKGKDKDKEKGDDSLPVDNATPVSNLVLFPGISHCAPSVDDNDECVIVFADGQQVREVDAILWCTGFLYDFPFIDAQTDPYLRAPITVEGGKRVRSLHLQLLSIEDPSLAFIGLPFSVVPFPLIYFQALFIAAVYSGKVTLPCRREQYVLLEEREDSLRTRAGLFDDKYHYLGDEQFQYMRMLARSSGHLLPPIGSSGGDEEKPRQLGRYIDLIEAIYTDNGLHKPKYVGAPDTYRNRRYRVNW